MTLESPLMWASLHNEKKLRKALRRDADTQPPCVKSKCRSRRELQAAILCNALNQKDDAKKSLELCFTHLNAWSPQSDEDGVRKKVLTMLASKAASDLGLQPMVEEPSSFATGAEQAMFRYFKGKFFFRTFHIIQAKGEFLRSFRLSPESNFVLLSLAITFRSLRRTTDRFRKPDALEIEILKKKLERTGDVRAASRLAAALLDELQSDNSGGDVRLSPRELGLRWNKILDVVERVVSSEDGKAKDLVYVADVLRVAPKWLDRRAQAEPLYRRALAMKPKFSTAHHKLGKLLVLTGKVDEGIEHLRVASGPDRDDNIRAFMDYLSVMYYRDPSFNLDAEFRRAKELTANSYQGIGVTVSYAQFKSVEGDFAAATALLDEAVELQRTTCVDERTEYDVFPPDRYKNVVPKEQDEIEGISSESRSLDGKSWREPALNRADPRQLAWRRGVDQGPRSLYNQRGERGARGSYLGGTAREDRFSRGRPAPRPEKMTIAALKEELKGKMEPRGRRGMS